MNSVFDSQEKIFAKMQRERMHQMFIATLGNKPIMQARAWTQSAHCPVQDGRYREEIRSVYALPASDHYFVMTKIISNGYLSCNGYQCDEFDTLIAAKQFAAEVYDHVYMETNAAEIMPLLLQPDTGPRLSLVGN